MGINVNLYYCIANKYNNISYDTAKRGTTMYIRHCKRRS